jgi:hypothetical protein
MKIVSIDEDAITFDDGRAITHDHEQDCCEWNYADFKQLDDLARNYDFETELKFEDVEEYGFRFGDSRRMFFIPCYSVQNGYYSRTVDIYFDGKCVLSAEGEWVDG